MEEARLRVALDANVLIAGVRLPRWPYEVMRAALRGFFDLLLPSQVVEEAERHLQTPAQADALRFFLANARCQVLPMPTSDLVGREPDLVRSETDVPIALSLLEGEVDIFVSNDRDFTDPGATAERFREGVRVMLPALFLRDVLGWSSEALESIRNRQWDEVAASQHPQDAES